MRPVKTDDNLAVDIEDRNPKLTRLVHGFFAPLRIFLYVAVFVLDAELIEILHGGVAKRTPLSSVHNYFHVHNLY